MDNDAQLAHWGYMPFPRNYLKILEGSCRVNVFLTTACELGLMDMKDSYSYLI